LTAKIFSQKERFRREYLIEKEEILYELSTRLSIIYATLLLDLQLQWKIGNLKY